MNRATSQAPLSAQSRTKTDRKPARPSTRSTSTDGAVTSKPSSPTSRSCAKPPAMTPTARRPMPLRPPQRASSLFSPDSMATTPSYFSPATSLLSTRPANDWTEQPAISSPNSTALAQPAPIDSRPSIRVKRVAFQYGPPCGAAASPARATRTSQYGWTQRTQIPAKERKLLNLVSGPPVADRFWRWSRIGHARDDTRRTPRHSPTRPTPRIRTKPDGRTLPNISEHPVRQSSSPT